jgi:hypothetical protein
MPASEKLSRAFATTSSSTSNPTVARIGVAWFVLIVGLALWATTQMEQAAASLCVG